MKNIYIFVTTKTKFLTSMEIKLTIEVSNEEKIALLQWLEKKTINYLILKDSSHGKI